ncbi:MAG: YraN family protein [Bacteroidales bacterium]|nr:YraN family protein [Bacteroidales bacterium]MCF8455444.1 YraN family protein [Bacteroidales bacterium]
MESEKKQVNEPIAEYGRPVTFDDVWKMFQVTDKQFKETDKQMKETDERMKETDKRMKDLQNLFIGQWGKLIESLVKGDLVRVLNEWGIAVQDTSERRKGNYKGTSYEFDIIARNGKEVVFVEVKTTLRPNDVKDFIDKLHHVKEWLQEYKDNIIYGAMAFLTDEGASARMAEKKGLFVIRATGDSAAIVNEKDFRPQGF